MENETKTVTGQEKSEPTENDDISLNSDKRRIKSATGTGTNLKFHRNSYRASAASNGEVFYPDYVDFDLEEPFSDSDDESDKNRRLSTRKLDLPIPRGRIRTLSGTVPIVGYSPKWGGLTMCIGCLQFFDLPSMIQQFTRCLLPHFYSPEQCNSSHLLEEHHIVVDDIQLIVDLKRYVEYWRQRFAKVPIEEIFSKILPNETDPHFDNIEYYFAMSATLAEDYSLRQRLAMRRLEEVLSCQQRERENVDYRQQCLFCRFNVRGNRSKIVHHLYMIHHLNLGSPDNLVFVTEYVEYLREKLNRGECIFCEHSFQDRILLMEHMRKKQHREVNPSNNYYDKFYIINYLELGKKWLDVLAEDFEDTMPSFLDSDEEEEEESWHEWQEDNLDEESRAVCLFCTDSFEQAHLLVEHAKDVHCWDFLKIFNDEKLDFYGRVKMINFIRKQSYNSVCFVCGRDDLNSWPALRLHQADNGHLAKGMPARDLWDREQNLMSLFGNDHLLWMLESLLDESNQSQQLSNGNVSADSVAEQVIAEDLPELSSSFLADKEVLQSLK